MEMHLKLMATLVSSIGADQNLQVANIIFEEQACSWTLELVMVSLQLPSMWQVRLMQRHCLSSRFQQRPWIGYTYRWVSCKFYKSYGPVRYAPRSTKQPKHTKPHQRDVEETDEHVPSVRFQDCHLPELLHSNGDHTKQDRITRPIGEPSLDEEDDLSNASTKGPHVYESRGNSARESKRSLEVYETLTHTEDIPLNALNISQQSCPLSEGYDPFCYSGKYQEEACTSNGLLCKDEGKRATTDDRKHDAEQRYEGPRYSQESSAHLSKFPITTKTQQTFDTEAVSNVGLLENELDCAGEKAQTKKKNPFAFIESNVESKVCPQAVNSIPCLPSLSKHPVSRGPNFQLPKDVKSFLLKVQKAKQRGREVVKKTNDANFAEGSLCDNDNERDDNSNDDRCLYLGQETLDDGAVVTFQDAVSNSTATQEHAKNQAIRYLAMRPYTASQLRKKLESQNITSELADYALATVQKCGLQSDLVYAETFSRARFNHSSWGPQRIKLGLKQRGISNEIIQAAIASVFCEEENDSDKYERLQSDMNTNSAKMSRAAMDHLLVQATKQWNRGRNATIETKIRRMVSWLQYRGFKYEVIKTILQHLQKEVRIEDE